MSPDQSSDYHGMHKNIHLTLLKRLTIAWLLLSVTIGAVVLYLDTERIDEIVVGLARKESALFSARDFTGVTGGNVTLLQRKADALIHSHFMIIELYDANKRQLLHAVHPDAGVVESHIDKHGHSFPLQAQFLYRKLLIERHLYLQVLIPMTERGTLMGYFEGVYRVDDATQAEILSGLLRSLSLVAIIILLTTLTLYPVILHLNRGLIRYAEDLLRGNIELMSVLGSAIAKRDGDTNIHNYRVTLYCIHTAEALDMASPQIRDLIAGAFLHDVGKIGIRDDILLKPDKLSTEETASMRAHVRFGVEIIEKSQWLDCARAVVECHHERFDGSGYPNGLCGDDIPLVARIFAIVDVFDALTSRRPYKDALGYDETIEIMERDVGSHFDPGLFAVFRRIARPLYDSIAPAEPAQLAQRLSQLVYRYFHCGNAG